MKSILTLTTIILYTGTNAQNSPPKAGLSRETITDPINVGAQFPGGKKALQKYLQKNLRPEIASDNIVLRRLQKDSIQIVIVSFLVDTTGNISEVRVKSIR